MARQKITVRMARDILGDCFLITFEAGNQDRPVSILIDFGVLQAVAGGKAKMQELARSIKHISGGHLDYVVVTHEHADHISGFAHASQLFFSADPTQKPEISIGTLWMAWTEDPQDPQANVLRQQHGQALGLLASVLEDKTLAMDEETTRAVERARHIFDFNIFPEAAEDKSGKTDQARPPRWTGARIMQELKRVAGRSVFLEPGDMQLIAGAAGSTPLKVHVLGPPRDEGLLTRSDPSAKNPETYLVDPSDLGALMAASRHYISDAGVVSEADPPRMFVNRFVALDMAAEGPDVKISSPDKRVMELWARYEAKPDRQLSIDFAGAAQRLALKLDSDTNNTSLVLAFELADGQVLLFAADAQVGNWLSWDRQRYPKTVGDGETNVDIHNLLSRVRLYKVGHHGSHNATIKMPGLESMTHPELEAMIPVVEAVASQQGTRGWKMPDPDLMKRFAEKRTNILQGDNRDLSSDDPLWIKWELSVA